MASTRQTHTGPYNTTRGVPVPLGLSERSILVANLAVQIHAATTLGYYVQKELIDVEMDKAIAYDSVESAENILFEIEKRYGKK